MNFHSVVCSSGVVVIVIYNIYLWRSHWSYLEAWFFILIFGFGLDSLLYILTDNGSY